jgi:hypothetical protein
MSDEFANVNIADKCCCDEDERIVVHSNDDPFQKPDNWEGHSETK